MSTNFQKFKSNDNGLTIQYLQPGQFIIPGFIDGHIHAVQFPNLGIGYDKLLLEWLDSYTMPLEKRFRDIEFATQVFDTVVVSDNSGFTDSKEVF